MSCKCDTCGIHKQAVEEGACCTWYMDNVVILGKSVDDCTVYKPLKTKGGNK